MAYTNNVPQGNQQIATTQPLIQANFGFIQSAFNQEHNFDPADPTKTYHLKASMPNQADPVSLPLGTNGIYYVRGGVPKFFNTSASFIQLTSVPYKILTGTAALTTSASTVVNIPANSCGQYYLFKKSSTNTVNDSSATGLFNTDDTTLFVGRTSDFDPGISVSTSGRNLKAETTSGSFNGTYTYLVVYFNP